MLLLIALCVHTYVYISQMNLINITGGQSHFHLAKTIFAPHRNTVDNFISERVFNHWRHICI